MTNVKKATNTPPLRYTGGKWMLADWIIAQFPSCEIYVTDGDGAPEALRRMEGREAGR